MWPFTKKRVEVHATTVPEMLDWMRSSEKRLQQQHDELREEVDRLKAQHLSLRGRVYAIWGKGKSSDDDAVPGAGSPQPPRAESKEEVKQRLLREGVLVPGKPFKHTN